MVDMSDIKKVDLAGGGGRAYIYIYTIYMHNYNVYTNTFFFKTSMYFGGFHCRFIEQTLTKSMMW